MKSKVSLLIIVAISLFVSGLHMVIGSYHGLFRDFIHGYLIDLLLPMNFYLLFQHGGRRLFSLRACRIVGAAAIVLLSCAVELLQYLGYSVLGTTFDPLDILIYFMGVGLGILVDVVVLSRYERVAVSG